MLTAEEHAAGSKRIFKKLDTDQDGFLSQSELAAGHAEMMEKGIIQRLPSAKDALKPRGRRAARCTA